MLFFRKEYSILQPSSISREWNNQSWPIMSMQFFRKEYSNFQPSILSRGGIFSFCQVYFSSERNIQSFSHPDFPWKEYSVLAKYKYAFLQKGIFNLEAIHHFQGKEYTVLAKYKYSFLQKGIFNLSAIQPFQGRNILSLPSILFLRKEYPIFQLSSLFRVGIFSIGQVYFSSVRNIQFSTILPFQGRNIPSWPSILFLRKEYSIFQPSRQIQE